MIAAELRSYGEARQRTFKANIARVLLEMNEEEAAARILPAMAALVSIAMPAETRPPSPIPASPSAAACLFVYGGLRARRLRRSFCAHNFITYCRLVVY